MTPTPSQESQAVVNELSLIEQELQQNLEEMDCKPKDSLLWWQAERRVRQLEQRWRYLRSLMIPNLCA